MGADFERRARSPASGRVACVSEQFFDVVVLGAGPAGEVAAGRLAEAGLRVALVEADLVGGECSFYACMPSKALLRPFQVLDEVRRVPGAREAVGGELDVDAVLRRRDEVVHDLHDDAQLPWVESRGITLVRGHGRLDGERRVRVADQQGGDGDARRRARRDRRHRQRRGDAPDPRAGRRQNVEQPRGDDREVGPRLAADPRRRRRRRRARAGLVVARDARDARRGARLAAGARGALRRRTGGRRAARARGGGPPRSQGGARRARRRRRCRPRAARRARRCARASCSWPSDAARTPRPSAWRRWGCRRERSSRSMTACAYRATAGCTRSATSTGARCSPIWASTRPRW